MSGGVQKGSVGGRVIVDITDWDCGMHVGMPPRRVPPADLFQGWLLYTRSIEVQGRIASPSIHRGKTVSFWILPVPERVKVTKADRESPAFQRVGHFGETTSPDGHTDFVGSVHAPGEALPTMVAALGSVWRVLQFEVAGDPRNGGGIEWFSFSRSIPPKLVRDDFVDD